MQTISIRDMKEKEIEERGEKMNTKAKGKRLENLAVKILERNGCKILFKSVFVKFQPVDFAGLFDIVAVKERTWYFIQVKSRMDRKRFKELVKFKENTAPLYSHVEMWGWNTKKKHFDCLIA